MSLLLVVYLIYRIYPPEVTQTPHATQLARDALSRMGPMSRDERIMLAVFVLIAGLWMTTAWHHVPYTVVALFGVAVLLLTNVLAWEDVFPARAGMNRHGKTRPGSRRRCSAGCSSSWRFRPVLKRL